MDDLWTTLAVNFGASLIATVFVYLLVPCVILITGKKYRAKTIKRITIINCIVCWILFRIIQIELGMEPRSGAAVILWGGIGYSILKTRCLKKDSEESPAQSDPVVTEPPTSSGDNVDTPYSLSNIDETPESCGNPHASVVDYRVSLSPGDESQLGHNRSGFNFRDHLVSPVFDEVHYPDTSGTVEKTSSSDEPAPVQHTATQNDQTATAKARYCSKCGSAIDSKTKKCTGCGKQYFKGIPRKSVCTIALGVLLVTSIAGNIVLYSKNDTLEKEKIELNNDIVELKKANTTLNNRADRLTENNIQLEKEKSRLQRELRTAENEIAFYDEHVVFVEDDGTRLYHNYSCNSFLGKSFWAFNINAAKGDGYKPCSKCCD